ncbi:putative zinc finger protein At1g68190 isoform X2 [Salvia miltiorrhiza]|uniref:putative zinc finger protein At1g68190 isoform X2 n=1 Tax=Salvia miltiorrhiza TaxID=226208 RepID=UPI0025AD26D5|nr:putative zinc finger protein At1g68190 isoform X2 [Salvia miltiorrhiza]
MEKRCEFCAALRPVVFCKSDAAHLCLPCDAKVHSANALSYRHPRTLVCESCRNHPASLRCFHHQTFMCQSCHISRHASLDHCKKKLSCYVGCPSARDLADLWGFQIKQSVDNSDEVGNDGSQEKRLILQQILDLERLQLSDDSCLSSRVKERPGVKHEATWKEHGMLENQHLEHSDAEESLSSPFPQLDSLAGNGNPMAGDAFWQHRSPLHNNEIWAQNMQDLGVCDEVGCFEDVNIPDVDLTFQSFEELFGSEQEPTNSFEDENPSFHATKIESDKEMANSVSLFSVSRITGESSGSHSNDDDFFPRHVSCDQDITKLGDKENVTIRYKDKKISRHERQAPRSKSDFKKRGKSQVLKVEDDRGNVSRSF